MSLKEEFISVGSRVMIDIELLFNGARHVITGISHPVTDGMAVTHNVPAEAFRQWYKDNADSPMISGSQVFELPPGFDATPRAKVHGFQPVLEAVLNAPDQKDLAAKGSPEELAPPVAGSAGLAIPIPTDLPKPPTEVTVTKQVPNAETHTETETRKVDTTIGAAVDSPTQDVNLSTDGSSTSSNQQPNVQNIGPTEDQTVQQES